MKYYTVMSKIEFLLVGILALVVAGCGGGGSSPAPTPPPVVIGTNATLSSLTTSVGDLEPAFSSAQTSYTLNVDDAVLTTTFTATVSDSKATIKVSSLGGAAFDEFTATSGESTQSLNLVSGINSFQFKVTAEDGTTEMSYVVEITQQSTNANLSSMAFDSSLAFSPAFDSNTLNYVAVDEALSLDETLAFMTENSAATVTVNGQAVDANGRYVLPARQEGENLYAIDVTSEFGNVKTYQMGVIARFQAAYAQQAYVKASNTGTDDGFGFSVAVSGDTMVVGAYNESGNGADGQDDNSLPGAGAVYVYVYDGSNWVQQAYLKAAFPGVVDRFGLSVSIDQDTIAIGAPRERSSATGVNGDQSDNSFNNVGAAYIFVRDNGVWTQQAYLKASNSEALDNYGQSVSVSGDTVVVGAYGESSNSAGINGDQVDNSIDDAGAVYVYTRDTNGEWSQQAYIKASNPSEKDWFGWPVALDGNTLAVGAFQESSDSRGINGAQDNDLATNSGAVYVFTRDSNGAWSQQAYLKSSNADASDEFGVFVAISGNTIAVGATNERSSFDGGVLNPSDNSLQSAGAVYVFSTDDSGNWYQQAMLKAPNADANDFFGNSVSVDGDTLVVSAFREDSAFAGVDQDGNDDAALDSGAAYVFHRDIIGQWRETSYLKASNADTKDQFGYSSFVSGDKVFIGANYEQSASTGINQEQNNNETANRSGAVYVFDKLN